MTDARKTERYVVFMEEHGCRLMIRDEDVGRLGNWLAGRRLVLPAADRDGLCMLLPGNWQRYMTNTTMSVNDALNCPDELFVFDEEG